MKKAILQCALLVGIAATAATQLVHTRQQESPDAELKAAINRELADGDTTAAIRRYREIESRYRLSRPDVAAKASLHAWISLEQIASPQSKSAYDDILRSYPGQTEVVAQARARLAQTSGGGLSSTTGIQNVQVLSNRSVEGGPSPDGRYLLTVDYSQGQAANLALRDLVTGEQRALTRSTSRGSFAEFPVFTSDGRTVYFGWYEASTDEWSFRSVTVDGSNERTVLNEGVIEGIVSPDRRQLVGAMTQTGNFQIATVDLSSRRSKQLKSVQWLQPVIGNFSPDGRFFVYSLRTSQDSPERDVFVMALDGTSESKVFHGAGEARRPFFTPDGRHVVFPSNRSGRWDLLAVKVSDGKAVGASEIVRPDVGDIEPLGFSNDGTYFYKQSLRQSDAYQVEIDPNVWKAIGAPTAIASRFVHSTMDPVWSPDASALAYVAQAGRSSTSATVVVRDERSGSEQHFDMSMERGGQLRWFPDNKALLYADNAPRGRRFRRLDLTTKEVQTLLETSYSPVLATVIAPDGRSFMFTSSDPDNSERKLVMRFDIATREQAKVYEAVLAGSGGPPAFHGFSVSPDGRQMAFFRSSTDETGFFNWELMVAMLDNEHPRRVWRSPTFRTLPGKATWDTQGRGVFAVVSLGDPFRDRHEIWRVPLDGSEPYSIGIPMNGGLGGAPAIHPRGNRLAFTVESNTANVWTLKNLPFGAKAVR